MSYQIVTNFTGQIGVNPRVVRVLTQDSLATVTTAGYITNTAINQILPTDIVLVKYSSGIGFFAPSFSNGVITLISSSVVPDNSVGTAQLQDGAVTAAKLATNAVLTAKINAGAVTLAKLAAGISPAFIVVASGESLTTAGGATMTLNVAGVVSTDVVMATMRNIGTVTDLTIVRSAPSVGQIVIQFSVDPLADSRFSYIVLRAAS